MFDEFVIKERIANANAKGEGAVGDPLFGCEGLGESGMLRPAAGKPATAWLSSLSSLAVSTSSSSKFDSFVNRKMNAAAASGAAARTLTTPFLRWANPTIVVPRSPYAVGAREDCVYCSDQRFPDRLNNEECVTVNTVSSWKKMRDGSSCSALWTCWI